MSLQEKSKQTVRAKIQALDAQLPVCYSFMALCAFGVLLSLFSLVLFNVGWLALLVCAALVGVGVHDLKQTRYAILRNYPVIGHLRFLFEFIQPEIRQYFIESDSEATAFPRAQRSLVYQRSKGEPDNQPFDTHLDVGKQGYEWVNHSMSPAGRQRLTFASGLAASPIPQFIAISLSTALHRTVSGQRLQYFGTEFWLAVSQRDFGVEQGRADGRLCT